MEILQCPLAEIERIVGLSQQITEFDQPYAAKVYKERLESVPHLILIAMIQGSPAGFKVGYERDPDGSFYSWMGGVKADFRKQGIAQKLADYQHSWARNQGYSHIRMKTRNRHRAMLHFAINSGFHFVKVEAAESIEENRIWLEKRL